MVSAVEVVCNKLAGVGSYQTRSSGFSTADSEQTHPGDVRQQDSGHVHQQARRYQVEMFVDSSKVDLAQVPHVF